MPRYFFQIIDGELLPDLEGVELPDLAAARHAAVDIAAERLKGSRGELWRDNHWRLEIVDQEGAVLAVLTLATETAPPAQTTIKREKGARCSS